MNNKRKGRRWVVFVSGIMFFCLAFAARADQPELREFFQRLRSPDAQVRSIAHSVLGSNFELVVQQNVSIIKTEILPIIFAALKDPQAEVKHSAAFLLYILASWRDVKELERLPPEQRQTWWSEKKGPLYEEIVPVLIKLLADADTRIQMTAAMALAVTPPRPPTEARPALLALLQKPTPEQMNEPLLEGKTATLAALSLMRPVVPEVVEAIVGILKKETTSVWEQSIRSDAVRALGNLGATDPRVIPAAGRTERSKSRGCYRSNHSPEETRSARPRCVPTTCGDHKRSKTISLRSQPGTRHSAPSGTGSDRCFNDFHPHSFGTVAGGRSKAHSPKAAWRAWVSGTGRDTGTQEDSE